MIALFAFSAALAVQDIPFRPIEKTGLRFPALLFFCSLSSTKQAAMVTMQFDDSKNVFNVDSAGEVKIPELNGKISDVQIIEHSDGSDSISFKSDKQYFADFIIRYVPGEAGTAILRPKGGVDIPCSQYESPVKSL